MDTGSSLLLCLFNLANHKFWARLTRTSFLFVFCLSFVFVFEDGVSLCSSGCGLKLTEISLPQCWDKRHEPLCLAHEAGFKPKQKVVGYSHNTGTTTASMGLSCQVSYYCSSQETFLLLWHAQKPSRIMKASPRLVLAYFLMSPAIRS